MGAVSTPALAVAVAEAGGVGTLSATGLAPGEVRTLLAPVVGRTAGVLAVNFVTDDVDPEAVAEASRHVPLVDFFWSSPDPSLVDLVHSCGALVNWQVGSLGEAVAAAAAGCDVVTVQGREAGGHVRGRDPLLPLVAAAARAVDVPVLAAGGLTDGRAVAAVMAAGAAGVRVGTGFVATDESGAHPAYKAALVDAGVGATQITDAFALCPLCATSARARVLTRAVTARRAFTGTVVGSAGTGERRTTVPTGSGMPPTVTTSGHIEAMALYAGAGTASIRDVVPAARVVERLGAWC